MSNVADNAVGTVQVFKTKPLSIEAIQYTGKNGKDVVAFAKKNDFGAKNGGRYISIFMDGMKITVRKGMFVAVEMGDGRLGVFEAEDFKKFHTISKNHVIL